MVAAISTLVPSLMVTLGQPAGASSSTSARVTSDPVAAIAPSRVTGVAANASGRGLWRVTDDGRIFPAGNARHLGAAAGKVHAGISAIAATKTGNGYWLVDKQGRVFAFGDASLHGSLPALGVLPKAPVVGIAPTPTGEGYWLATADGGVFTFGDAKWRGSAAMGVRLPFPIIGIASTTTGRGYWLAASDGGVFTFGDAANYGSLAGKRIDRPVVDFSATASGRGYRMAAADGGVFNFGDAKFYGSAAPSCPATDAAAITSTRNVIGYWVTLRNGRTFAFAPGATQPRCPHPATSNLGAQTVGGLFCPIAGPVHFRNDWGDPRSGGRTHKGTDLFNPQGTPNVAIMGGYVFRQSERLGGLTTYLNADDGNTYYYAHLSGYAGPATGRVSAGQTIGYTGNTGNASGGPAHTHFEIRIGSPSGTKVNPYPTLARICTSTPYI